MKRITIGFLFLQFFILKTGFSQELSLSYEGNFIIELNEKIVINTIENVEIEIHFSDKNQSSKIIQAKYEPGNLSFDKEYYDLMMNSKIVHIPTVQTPPLRFLLTPPKRRFDPPNI